MFRYFLACAKTRGFLRLRPSLNGRDRNAPRRLRVRRVLSLILGMAASAMGMAQSLTPDRARTHFISTTYGANAGVPLPIEDIVQTHDGYLWMATEAGLARFDGMRFSVYRTSNSPGLRYNGVRSLFEDKSGWLWIATERGLSRYRDGRFEEVGSATISFGAFAEDRDGTIWAGSDRGLWQYRHGELRLLEQEPLVAGKTVRFLMADTAGRIWIIAGRTLLCRESGRFRVFEHGGAPLENVVALAEAADGALWLATSNRGVLRLKGGALDVFGEAQGLGAEIVSQVFIDQKGNIWAIAAGVHILRREQPDRFVPVLPRAFENFQPIEEDREGNIWLGTHAEGLIRVTPTTLQAFQEENGLPVGSVRSVTEDAQGRLWASLVQQPLTAILPDGKVEQMDPENGYGDDPYGTFTAADGSVWHGCKRGLQVMRGGKLEVYPEYPHVRAIFQDRSGAVWLAPDGRVVRFKEGRFEEIGGRDGMPDSAASCFSEGADGTLYIGFRKEGLATLKAGVVKVHNAETGLPTNTVRGVHVDRDANVWLGLKGRGLALLRDGRWLNPEEFSEFFQDQVSVIIEDDQDNLFFGSMKGVFYARRQDVVAMALGRAPVHFTSVVLSDGVRSDEVSASAQPAVWKARSGMLWFATRQGLFGVDPQRLGTNDEPPPVYIERALVDGRPRAIGDGLTLSAGTLSLQVDYTGLGFTRPQDVRFKYKLEGYDTDWVDAGARRTAYYTHLEPGRYRFRVVACNNDGVWNETGASMAVVQSPWFYQTTWFRLLLGCVALTTVLIFSRWRMARVERNARELQRQNIDLEKRIAERTAELAKSYDALRISEYFYHSLVESLPQIIVRKDAEGRVTYANDAFAQLLCRPVHEIIGKSDGDLYSAERAEKNRADDLRVMQTRQPMESELVVEREALPKRYLHVKKVPLFGEGDVPIGVLLLFWDMTVFRETEEKLKAAQRELLETSRLAGMAEIATDVLHNIGNTLNSVNTSANVAAERLRTFKLPGLQQVVQLLLEQGDGLPNFFANDPRAQRVPGYLDLLFKHLTEQRDDALRELAGLQKHIEQINQIVAAQQRHTQGATIEEIVPAAELVEYALSIEESSLRQAGISVSRESMPVPAVKVQRQKALQVLRHLIRNAAESIGESGHAPKLLTLGLRTSAEGNVQIYVVDNGVGIDAENLTRVFSFGFTTKPKGQGFGLHASALAAHEMGGTLSAQSGGKGSGATFIFELPPADDGVPIRGTVSPLITASKPSVV
jgi:PAS domain S-box-containing protein